MRVWRVEHGVDGYGPYCSGKGRDEVTIKIAEAHSYYTNREIHPTTAADGFWERLPVGEGYYWRHGLNRYYHVLQWFKGFAEDLRSVGFVVAVYDVASPHVMTGESRRQVMFNPDHATWLRKREIWRE